jgi:hypothetical protein
MKKLDIIYVGFLIIFTLLFTSIVNAQSKVGVMGGFNFTMEKPTIGVMINKPATPDITFGVGYMSSLENLDKGTFMANYQTNIFNFSIGGGLGIPVMDGKKPFPFLLLTYKPWKDKSLRIFLNSTSDRQVVGLALPIFKIK